jgi:cellulose synthase/poly-beta-1,6-N-acetylglucosamine synthase-like glycosyltransferase
MPYLSTLNLFAAVVYAAAVGALAIYAIHSAWLLSRFLRFRRDARILEADELSRPLPDELPHVLVQLPVFNERDVVDRLVDAVGRLSWPADRLHLQLLDDSTDDSVQRGAEACARLRASGLDCIQLCRPTRSGFKAGALDHGMQQQDSPFIAIFDADFVPEPDFLERAIRPLIADPQLALVQGRWAHLNREENSLTRAQALGIDGHFAVEQGARAWSGLAMNFNGTCGLWRRSAIIAGGGWEHDTLTEDMDLSYRVQLAGWRCTYRLGLAVPGEIPASVNAWRSQQFRWAKGSLQTAIKLLPRVWRSPWSLNEKLAATLHMKHYLVHPLILVSLLTAALALVAAASLPSWFMLLGLACFLIGAATPPIIYLTAQLVLHGAGGWRRMSMLPALAAFGTGIAISNTRAAWQALRGHQSSFVRTPKAGSLQGAKTSSYRSRAASGYPKLACAAWAAMALVVGYELHPWWVSPLLGIYCSGFLWMGIQTMRERAGALPYRRSWLRLSSFGWWRQRPQAGPDAA